jgi:hypothetical protein
MNNLIESVKIMLKIEECYNSAKFLYKDGLRDKLQWYKDVIQKWQKKHGKEILPSVIEICGLDSISENGMAVMLFMAATWDMIENDKLS